MDVRVAWSFQSSEITIRPVLWIGFVKWGVVMCILMGMLMCILKGHVNVHINGHVNVHINGYVNVHIKGSGLLLIIIWLRILK